MRALHVKVGIRVLWHATEFILGIKWNIALMLGYIRGVMIEN